MRGNESHEKETKEAVVRKYSSKWVYLQISLTSQENTCVGVFGVFFNKVVGPPVATSESNRLVEKRVGGMGGGGCKYVNSIWDFSLFTEQGVSGKK